MQNFRQFKQFDTVDSFPNHFYDKKAASTSEAQRPKNWAKKNPGGMENFGGLSWLFSTYVYRTVFSFSFYFLLFVLLMEN
ncbi:putative ubiquitin-conjugating enzyme E2 [Trifolium repens]|nr:putative ubiquitin-conjugating enzyme E2 [Trifolium repens]